MQIILNELPQTAAAFSAADLSRPEMTCALFLAALQLYTRDANAGAEAWTCCAGRVP